jgi:hypothetical protein
MRREIWTTVVLIAMLIGFVSCALSARIYNLDNGEVVIATFKYSGTGRGSVKATLPSGEVCKGEYVTVAGGTTGWGSVFPTVYGPGGSASASSIGYGTSIENKQKGTAIVIGNRGTVVECEYVTSAFSAQGYGACRDNKGNRYKLMF